MLYLLLQNYLSLNSRMWCDQVNVQVKCDKKAGLYNSPASHSIWLS
jgi:hypothetical protein